MPRISVTAENAAATAVAALITYISLHSADPGTTGASEASTARVAVAWGSASAGVVANTGSLSIAITGTVGFWGGWTAITGGTYITGGVLAPITSTSPVPIPVGGLTITGS